MTKDQTGSVAEEAAKLFAALKGAGGGAAPPPGDTSGQSDTDFRAHEGISRECQWCPVCQLIRRVGPDAVEQVVASVRGLLDAVAAAARESGTPHAKADTESPIDADTPVRGESDRRKNSRDSRSGSKVDRIDVSEDPERWD